MSFEQAKKDLTLRIDMLKQAIEQSLANHHALLGRFEEAKFSLKTLEDKELNEALAFSVNDDSATASSVSA